jgi:hypothetical protein
MPKSPEFGRTRPPRRRTLRRAATVLDTALVTARMRSRKEKLPAPEQRHAPAGSTSFRPARGVR